MVYAKNCPVRGLSEKVPQHLHLDMDIKYQKHAGVKLRFCSPVYRKGEGEDGEMIFCPDKLRYFTERIVLHLYTEIFNYSLE